MTSIAALFALIAHQFVMDVGIVDAALILAGVYSLTAIITLGSARAR